MLKIDASVPRSILPQTSTILPIVSTGLIEHQKILIVTARKPGLHAATLRSGGQPS